MFDRMVSLFKPAPKEVDAITAIDFKMTAFDPANRAHRNCIDAKINHLNVTYNLLVKTDILIFVPYTMNILLTVSRVLGLGLSLLVCAGISAILYASNQFQNHLKYQTEFYHQLAELVAIWRASVKLKGSDITDDPTILKILRAIAPFVASELLLHWKSDQTYPDANFSEKFVEIVTTPPHKIPRVLLKGEVPVKKEETQMSHAGLLQTVAGVTTNNRWFDLYRSSIANLNFTLYAYQPTKVEEEKVQQGLLRLLR